MTAKGLRFNKGNHLGRLLYTTSVRTWIVVYRASAKTINGLQVKNLNSLLHENQIKNLQSVFFPCLRTKNKDKKKKNNSDVSTYTREYELKALCCMPVQSHGPQQVLHCVISQSVCRGMNVWMEFSPGKITHPQWCYCMCSILCFCCCCRVYTDVCFLTQSFHPRSQSFNNYTDNL